MESTRLTSLSRIPRISVRRHRSGFTLVELLVVVSIIALLISILLPSLRSARDQAKQVKCFASLHATHLALICYADDNRQELPSYTTMGGWGFRVAPGKISADSAFPETYGVQSVLHTGHAPIIMPNGMVRYEEGSPVYLASDSKVWLCPANPGPMEGDGDHGNWVDYGNTYYYRTNSGTKSDFSQPGDEDWDSNPKRNYNIDYLNRNVRVGSLALLLMGNYHKYPSPSGMGRPVDDEDYNVPGELQQPPHRVAIRKKGAGHTWAANYADGHVQLNVFNH